MPRRPIVRRVSGVLAASLGLALVLAGCGGGGGGVTKQAVDGNVEVNARDINYDVKTIEAPPGPLHVTLRENGSLPHTFTISDKDFEIRVESDKKEASGTVDLEPGTYEFHCTVPGHSAMKGTVVVA